MKRTSRTSRRSMNRVERVTGMLMIGSAGRSAGKTEFVCAVIAAVGGSLPVTGVKVTTVAEGEELFHGKDPGHISFEGDFLLTKETEGTSDKDTARMLKAGADRVYWLRVRRESMVNGLAALKKEIGSGVPVVCESNSLRLVAEPDLFIVVREKGADSIKPSCTEVIDLADASVISDGRRFSVSPLKLTFEHGRWKFRDI